MLTSNRLRILPQYIYLNVPKTQESAQGMQVIVMEIDQTVNQKPSLFVVNARLKC